MIRLAILSLLLLVLWVYAFRDWMVSLCGLILLTVLMQNANMPSQIAGIPGLNPWNVTLAVVTVAWLRQRHYERRPWNVPPLGIAIAIGYVGLIVLGYVQAVLDMEAFGAEYQRDLWQFLTVDYLINPLKFVLVALLLADGCHTRRRLTMALGALVGLGVLYAVLVVKIIPLGALQQGAEAMHYRWRVDKVIGVGVNDLAKVLALTFWTILAMQRLWWRTWWSRVGVLAAYSVTFLGLALCYSRSAYLAFMALGVLLGFLRWRKLLWLGAPALLLLLSLMPSVTARVSMGFDEDGQVADWNEVSAGRTGSLWPPMLEEIWKGPLVGHGRLAILHTPAYDKIAALGGTVPVTPHNGFLEILADHGALGLIIVLASFLGATILSHRLMREVHDPLVVALGGVGLVHAVGNLVDALVSGTLLPNQGLLGTLCALALVLRVWSGRHAAAHQMAPAGRAAWGHRPA
jgi:O-antigen ligase